MSSPIEMRKYLAIMYGKNPIKSPKETVQEIKKDMSMRDMMGKMRVLNEGSELGTSIDKAGEEGRMDNYFDEDNVTIEYEDFHVHNDGVLLTGTIDGQIQFAYAVTPNEKTSGINVNYLDGQEINPELIVELEKRKLWNNKIKGEIIESKGDVNKLHNLPEDLAEKFKDNVLIESEIGFDPLDPENEVVIKKVKSYYDIFYKYWRDQLFKQ